VEKCPFIVKKKKIKSVVMVVWEGNLQTEEKRKGREKNRQSAVGGNGDRRVSHCRHQGRLGIRGVKGNEGKEKRVQGGENCGSSSQREGMRGER